MSLRIRVVEEDEIKEGDAFILIMIKKGETDKGGTIAMQAPAILEYYSDRTESWDPVAIRQTVMH